MHPGKVPVSILLTGMKHTGKSSHGEAAARRFDIPFFDLDREILEIHRREGGTASSIRELYRTEGAGRFMELEALAAAALARAGKPSVVACGGGIADNPSALAAFREAAAPPFFFVHLSLPEEILFERIAAGGIPPFLEGEGGEAGARDRFHRLYLRREAEYRRQAQLLLELKERPLEENSALLIRAIEEY